MADKKKAATKTTKEVAGEAKAISIELIKKLKELSGVGLTDAKNALVEAKGDFDKALAAMRKKGLTKAEKRGDRETREGLVEAYIHDGRLGAIVEVNCETSFVAKTDEFKDLAHKIAIQVASMNPQWVSEADIPADKLKEARVPKLTSQPTSSKKLAKLPKSLSLAKSQKTARSKLSLPRLARLSLIVFL